MKPPDSPSTVRVQYDDWHSALEVDAEADAPWHRLVKEGVRQSGLAGKRVLEIACGRGGLAAWLGTLPGSLRPEQLVACDFSPVAVGKARELGARRGVVGVTYQVEDLSRLTFAAASFDSVISCETIEHMPDPQAAIGELVRVLRPGGALLLTCPNYLNLMGLHRLYRICLGKDTREAGQPINHTLLLPGVLRWLRRAGMKRSALRGAGHYIPIPRTRPFRLDAVDRVPGAALFALHPLIIATKSTLSSVRLR